MKPVNGMAVNGRHPPTSDEPETFDPLAEAEAIRLLVVEVGSRLARLACAPPDNAVPNRPFLFFNTGSLP